jgi:hypothetical protein
VASGGDYPQNRSSWLIRCPCQLEPQKGDQATVNDQQAIRDDLARLSPGREVRLELADGSTVRGKLRRSSADKVRVGNQKAVALADVADLAIVVRTQGPE